MEAKELLKPRYKVIGLWPDCTVVIGGILIKHNNIDDWLYLPKTNSSYAMNGIRESAAKKYPHLFKRLEWWHERDVKDLPDYIGVKDDDTFLWVAPVVRWDELRLNEQGLVTISFTNLKGEYEEVTQGIWSTTPATKEEYEQYKSTQK
jgi:hypothetical protein